MLGIKDNGFEKVGKGFWVNLPGWIIILISFLLPIIFLPSNLIDLGSIKSIAFLGLFYLAILVWVITKLKDSSFRFPINILSLSAALVPIVYIISSFFSSNFDISFFGRDFGFDSVLVLFSFFILLLLGSSIFQDKNKSIFLYSSVVLSILIVVILQLINIMIPGGIGLGFFDLATTNTVGKWFDFGVFAGIGLILSFVSIENLKINKKIKWLMGLLFILSLISLIFVGFRELWLVIGIFALIFATHSLINSRINNDGAGVRIPIVPLVVLIISALFVISGNGINFYIQNSFGIEFVEARPNLESTFEVTKSSFKENPILGEGPARFSNIWSNYKPLESNLSDLWSTDFRYGYGYVPTLIASTGVLGLLSWLFFLVMLLITGFKAIFRPIIDSSGRFILMSSFVLTLYLWLMNIVYIPSYATLFMTFIFTAVFIASLYREEMIKTKEISITQSPRNGFIYIFALIILLLVTVIAGYGVGERFAASIYDRQVLIAIGQNDLVKAEQKALRAIGLHETDTRLLTLSDIRQLGMAQILNSETVDEATRANLLQQALSESVRPLQQAIAYDPKDYNNFMKAGLLFSDLIQFSPDSFIGEARTMLSSAKVLSPRNPAIPLAEARAENRIGNNDVARELIREALLLKSNYTEAVFLLAQIDVSEGNVDEAIENIRLAATARPNDPVVFFQLGLLQYQNNQFSDAVVSFERAVILAPLYSNAKYFLGLSYSQVGRVENAILQFEDLESINPDNEEVRLILNNLKNSGQPFSSNTETDPEDRDELPLDDDLTSESN